MPTTAYKLCLDASQFISETNRANQTMLKFNKTQVAASVQLQAMMKATSAVAVSLGKDLAIMGAIGIGATSAAFAYGVSQAASYEEMLSRIAFWTDATMEDMKNFNNSILAISNSYGVQSKILMTNAETLAKIDMSMVEIITTMDIVAKTVVASGEEMEDVLSIVRIAFEAFGIPVTELEGMLDRLTYIAKKTSMDIGDMTYVLSRAGPIAELTSVSIEQLATATALFRATGMEASEASTALRRILAEIIKHAERYDEAFRLAGVSTQLLAETGELAFDDFIKVLGRLNETTEGQVLLTEILGETSIRAMGGISALANLSEKYFEIQSGLADSSGLLNDMFEHQSVTMSVLLNKMKVAFENAFLTNEAMGQMKDALGTLIPAVETFGKSFSVFVLELLKMFTELAPYLSQLIVSFSSVLIGLLPIIKGCAIIGMGLVYVLTQFSYLLPGLIVGWITYRLAVKLHTLALGLSKIAHLAHVSAVVLSNHALTLQAARLVLNTGITKANALAIVGLNYALTWTWTLTIALMGAFAAISLGMMISSAHSVEMKNKLRMLQVAIIGITSFIIGLKIAMWLYGLSATYAAIAQHQLLIPIVGGAIAAVAIAGAMIYAASAVEGMTSEMWGMSDVGEDLIDTNLGIIDTNFEIANSFGYTGRAMQDYYEVFLILTEDTQGYIIQMGTTIRSTTTDATSNFQNMGDSYTDMLAEMEKQQKEWREQQEEFKPKKKEEKPWYQEAWGWLMSQGEPSLPVGPKYGKTFQFGGIIPGPIDMPVPIIAHGGEEVITSVERTTGMGRGEVSINFNRDVNIYSKVDLIRFSRRIGKEVQRRLP